ncbi:MAG: hypothetical protein GX868_15785 [Actinobacteria bacterium]|nr:hypothetical protein [Actinomycetota bacterium]
MPEPTQSGRHLCYEGFPLESVLARVTADHGAAATITSAERVRKGGVKGFFAREVFQVIVDPGGEAGDDVAASTAAATFDSSEIDPEDVEGALALDLTGRGASGRSEPDHASFADDTSFAYDTAFAAAFGDDAELWSLLASTDSPERASTSMEHLPEPSLLAAPLLAAAPAPPVWASPVRSDLPFVTETVSSETVAAELVQPLRSLGPIAMTTVIPTAQCGASVFGSPFDPFRRLSVPQSDEVVAHRVATEALDATPTLPAARNALSPASTVGTPGDLPSLGALRCSVESGGAVVRSRLGSMMDSLDASLPPVPELPERGTIVVVGERTEAIAAAHALAPRLGLAPAAVLIVSPSSEATVPNAADLAALAEGLGAVATPLRILVVELLAGRQGHEWTRSVIGGVDPAQVRFVSDASRYVAHQHLSVAAIGGVDVVDLVGMDEVDEPTAALAVGIPIGSLDGRPASSELWAATLLVSRAVTVDSDSQTSAEISGAEGE